MSGKILVLGATGRVGGELVRLLLERGEDVRAASRTPGKLSEVTETVEFDFEDPRTFGPALKGIGKIFLIARPGDNHSDKAAVPLIETALREGVHLIVNLTAMGVENDETFPLRILENYIEKSGLAFVHLRPNWFMQNFSSGPMLAGILATGSINLPAAGAKISFIDTRDIAAVSAAVLTDVRYAGKAFTLTGGEALDHYQAAEAISRAAGRTISYNPLTEEAASAALRRGGVAEELITRWTNFYRIVRKGLCAPVTGQTESILGRPAITLGQFAEDYKEAWRKTSA